MNHLAHLFLATPTPESLAGNLAADFVKGSIRGRFSAGVEAGILQHRRIDAFTDAHPEAGLFRRPLVGEFRHYSRIIADIFLDHFLAAEFERYSSGRSLQEFAATTFLLLDEAVDTMPLELRRVYPRMRDEAWLLSYATVDGIEKALFYTSRRLARGVRLDGASHYLVDTREELQTHARNFLPEVIAYAGL